MEKWFAYTLEKVYYSAIITLKGVMIGNDNLNTYKMWHELSLLWGSIEKPKIKKFWIAIQ